MWLKKHCIIKIFYFFLIQLPHDYLIFPKNVSGNVYFDKNANQHAKKTIKLNF